MHPISVDDIVSSVGRIRVLQDGRMRYIAFAMAKVMEIGAEGITVNPLGKKALMVCRPEDLDLVETGLEQTPQSRASGEQVAEAAKVEPTPAKPEPEQSIVVVDEEPTGKIDVKGTTAQPEPRPAKPRDTGPKPKPKAKAKPTLKALKEQREKEDKAADKPKPKPRPRRRRDR